ncbi:MAG: HDOD domain-containing protein [Candidatus Methylomirabilia bacterium]
MTLSLKPTEAWPTRATGTFKERFLADVDSLPPLPPVAPVVARIMEILQDYQVSTHDVAQLLREDPGLTVRVLKIANSPVYGAYMPITSVAQAVLRLGMGHIRNIILTLGVLQSIGGPARRDFWRHSVTVALATEVIAQHAAAAREEAEADGAFAAGLLHDVGLLVLREHYPAVYAEVNRLAEERGLPLHEVEMAELQTDHGRMGALLASRWTLPAAIVSAIAFHHQPELAPASDRGVVDLVHLAVCLCACAGLGGPGGAVPTDPAPETLDNLGLRPASLSQIIEATQAAAQKSLVIVELAR